MAELSLQISGLTAVQAALSGMPDLARKGAAVGLHRAVQRLQGRVVKKAAETIALKQSVLRDSVRLSLEGLKEPNPSASVTLVVRPVRVQEFPVRVRMVEVGLRSRAGRTFVRRLPVVEAQIYKGRYSHLPSGFPLRQRFSGALVSGEKVRRRTGNARDKLTAFAMRTFTRKLLDTLVPELRAEGAQIAQVEVERAMQKLIRDIAHRWVSNP